MATVQEAIRKLTIVSSDRGLSETERKLRGLESAQRGVAVSSEKTERATLNVERQLASLQRRLDPAFRATTRLAEAERILTAARSQGLISAARQNELLALEAKNHVAAAGAASLHARALASLSATGALSGRALLGGLGLGGGVALGGVLAASLAIRTFVTNSVEAQKSLAQLNAVLVSTGGAAGMTAEALTDLATQMQRLTTFDDEAVLSAEAMLLTFTKVGKDVFPAAVQSILDMSIAMDQDLKTSTIQLGKALNDPIKGITALTRVGVLFTAAQKVMIESLVEAGDVAGAQTIILRELQKEFGGSAAAARDTLGGALTALGNAFGDLFEVSGPGTKALTDSINDLTATLSDPATIAAVQAFGGALFDALSVAVEQVRIFIGDLQNLKKEIDDIINAVHPPITMFSTENGGIEKLKKSVTDYIETVKEVPPVVAPVVDLTEDQISAAEHAQEAIDRVTNSLKFETEQFARSARDQAIYNQLKAAGVDINSDAGAKIAAAAGNLYDLEAAQKAATEAQKASTDANEKALKVTQDMVDTRQKLIDDIAFERNTLFLSEQDVGIATRLRSIYGDDIPAALSSSEAAAIRFNNRLKEVADLAGSMEDALSGAIAGVFNGSIKTAGEFLKAIQKPAAKTAAKKPKPEKETADECDDYAEAA